MLKANKPWDKNLQLLLASIVGFNVLPHAFILPIWVTAMAAFCVGWKFLYLTRGAQLPKRWLLGVGTVLAAIGVALNYYDSFSQETSAALLVIMASMKLLETNRYRDAMLVIFTSYFLLMSYLLESQSLPTTVYMILDVFLITALMFQVHRRDARSGPRNFKPALKLLALIVPLWIFLFIVFPRFSTGLWMLKSPQASTGFSDELNPGSIDRLVESDEIAFRADLKNSNLSPEILYWRGAILVNGKGLKWERSKVAFEPDVIIAKDAKPSTVSYDMYLESGMGNWLFGLDVPISISSADTTFLKQVRKRPGFIYQTARPSFARVAYHLVSRMSPPTQNLGYLDQLQSLKIPENVSQRTRDLADSLLTKSQNDSGFARIKSPEEKASRTLLKWFADNNFRYTKNPGVMLKKDGADQLDEFLFDKKIGFCEHFATAYASLMRAMKIPARVVIGFQGGTRNDYGNYYLVKKMDAHAWDEVWIADADSKAPTKSESQHGHWMRVDPTEIIAPLRLQLGGEYYRVDPTTIALGATGEAIRKRLDSGIAGFVRNAQAAWDAVQMQWNAFLLLYDLDYQMQLLARLGISDAAPYILVLVLIAGTLIFAGGFTWALRRRAGKKDPVLQEWRKFCRELERRGIIRTPTEGPLAFSTRAAALLPSAEKEIRSVAELFTSIRYGSNSDQSSTAAMLKRFRQAVRHSVRELSKAESSRSTTS